MLIKINTFLGTSLVVPRSRIWCFKLCHNQGGLSPEAASHRVSFEYNGTHKRETQLKKISLPLSHPIYLMPKLFLYTSGHLNDDSLKVVHSFGHFPEDFIHRFFYGFEWSLHKTWLSWILLNRHIKSQAINKYLQSSEISDNDNHKHL